MTSRDLAVIYKRVTQANTLLINIPPVICKAKKKNSHELLFEQLLNDKTEG